MTTQHLLAKTRVKYGSKVSATDWRGVPLTTAGGTMIMPGDLINADAEYARELLASGAAITRDQAREEAAALLAAGQELPAIYRAVAADLAGQESPEERLRRAADEARAAGVDVRLEVSAGAGGSVQAAAVHREAQAREAETIERASGRAAKSNR